MVFNCVLYKALYNKYIDMIIINYDYRIYCFDRGKMVVCREHICPT